MLAWLRHLPSGSGVPATARIELATRARRQRLARSLRGADRGAGLWRGNGGAMMCGRRLFRARLLPYAGRAAAMKSSYEGVMRVSTCKCAAELAGPKLGTNSATSAPHSRSRSAFAVSMPDAGDRGLRSARYRVANCAQHTMQCRHSVAYDAPHRIEVAAEIGVNQPVTRGDHLPPRDPGGAFSQLVGHVRGGLAQQLEIAQGGVVAHLIRGERLALDALRICEDALAERDHVLDVQRGIAQMPTASRSTNGRSRSRSAFSVTRSTRRPSRSSR